MRCDVALNLTCFFVPPSHRHPVVLRKRRLGSLADSGFCVEAAAAAAAAAARRVQTQTSPRFASSLTIDDSSPNFSRGSTRLISDVPGMISCLAAPPLTAVTRQLSVTEVPGRDVSLEINSRPESCFPSFLCPLPPPSHRPPSANGLPVTGF